METMGRAFPLARSIVNDEGCRHVDISGHGGNSEIRLAAKQPSIVDTSGRSSPRLLVSMDDAHPLDGVYRVDSCCKSSVGESSPADLKQ